jgi:hypothetical protein
MLLNMKCPVSADALLRGFYKIPTVSRLSPREIDVLISFRASVRKTRFNVQTPNRGRTDFNLARKKEITA